MPANEKENRRGAKRGSRGIGSGRGSSMPARMSRARPSSERSSGANGAGGPAAFFLTPPERSLRRTGLRE
eukprot:6995245-Alexandrium_andersonii.AAC.1